MENQTAVSRLSDRELLVTRSFNAPKHLIFRAWTTPDLLKRWWAPKSMGMSLVGCEVDARTGGKYRFEFGHNGEIVAAFFGKYVEVIPNTKLVWTNEESEDGALSTVTLEEANGKTVFKFHELYPSKEALDAAWDGTEACSPEQHAQLDELLSPMR